MFYRPEGKAVCADVIPFYEDGEFKLFYLKDYRDKERYGEGCDWHLLVTKDLVHFEDKGAVIRRGTEEEQDLYVYTGCCVKAADEYYVFYTGHNPHKRAAGLPEQKILLARGKDLLHLQKQADFCLQAPPNLEMHDFRDPYVFFDEDKKKYVMLIAAREKNEDPLSFKGILLTASSADLLHWTIDEQPFLAPKAYFTHECPDMFRIGDWWYLVFSEFTDRYITTYRMSKSPYGPWHAPKVNTFDGHAFYAAKSVSDGKRRVLFGWNPIKEGENDCGCWQWGGNIVAHELVQHADGTLGVKCPESILSSYSEPMALEETYRMNAVEKSGNGFVVGEKGGRSLVMFGDTPDRCRIHMDITPSDDIGDFGVILRADFNLPNNTFYTVRFEALHNRLSIDRWPRCELAKHTSTDTEKYLPLIPGKTYGVDILLEGSVAEIYVDGDVALGGRMFDFNGKWGLYAMNTTTRFANVTVTRENKNEKK